ncbi:Oncosphere antigen A [Echinococcus granulosus]|nr:Oncosphere antigen A [Echinococcus granulosus]
MTKMRIPCCTDLTFPQNVKLDAIDTHTVNMTWEPPAKHDDRITGYTIEWSLHNAWQKTVYLSSSHSMPLLICNQDKSFMSFRWHFLSSSNASVAAVDTRQQLHRL